DVVVRTDASEDTVDQPNASRAGRDEAADLGKQDDERHLAQVGGLAGHVRPGYHHHLAVSPVQPGVVRNEAARVQADLHHRVPPVDDLQLLAVVQQRAAVTALPGHLSQGGEDV